MVSDHTLLVHLVLVLLCCSSAFAFFYEKSFSIPTSNARIIAPVYSRGYLFYSNAQTSKAGALLKQSVTYSTSQSTNLPSDASYSDAKFTVLDKTNNNVYFGLEKNGNFYVIKASSSYDVSIRSSYTFTRSLPSPTAYLDSSGSYLYILDSSNSQLRLSTLSTQQLILQGDVFIPTTYINSFAVPGVFVNDRVLYLPAKDSSTSPPTTAILKLDLFYKTVNETLVLSQTANSDDGITTLTMDSRNVFMYVTTKAGRVSKINVASFSVAQTTTISLPTNGAYISAAVLHANEQSLFLGTSKADADEVIVMRTSDLVVTQRESLNVNAGSIALFRDDQGYATIYSVAEGAVRTLNLGCKEGSFVDDTVVTGCSLCNPGTYSREVSSLTCTPCNRGTYSGSHGATACTECPQGSFQNVTGQASCYKCPPGTSNYLVGRYYANDCRECYPGEYQDQEGSSTCFKCPAGSYNNQDGATTCALCPMGTYAAYSGSTSCTACPSGTVAPTEGSKKCESCPDGFYTVTDRITRCMQCPAGTYLAYRGATSCTKCSQGTYSNKVAQSGYDACDKCPVGTYAPNQGSTSCEPCPSAKTVGSTICLNVPDASGAAGAAIVLSTVLPIVLGVGIPALTFCIILSTIILIICTVLSRTRGNAGSGRGGKFHPLKETTVIATQTVPLNIAPRTT